MCAVAVVARASTTAVLRVVKWGLQRGGNCELNYTKATEDH